MRWWETALSWLDSPSVHWPLAAVLGAVLVWRLRRHLGRQNAAFAVDWLRRRYLYLVIPAALLVYVAVWIFVTSRLPSVILAILDSLDAGPPPDDVRDYAYALGALITALIVLATLPFALIKTWINERQAQTAEQGHITDRLTRAIEQLGAEKTRKFRVRSITYDLVTGDDRVPMETYQRPGENPDPPIMKGAENEHYGAYETSEETVPNLEVRLGAIYALERIAQDSERDHIPVMETLCAYIRENALSHEPRFEGDIVPLRVDISAVFDVIARRGQDRRSYEARRGYRPDLRNVSLGNRDLSHRNLSGLDMSWSDLRWAILYKADLTRTNLFSARLDDAHLISATLRGTQLWLASGVARLQFEGAITDEATMPPSDFV